MKTTQIVGNTPSLAELAAELKVVLARLRGQYLQASTRLELGPPRDPLLENERAVVQRQLKVLAPLHKALIAIAQQGPQKSAKGKALYLDRFTKVMALVDSMTSWADGSEEEFSELLALRLPVHANDIFRDGAVVKPLRDRLESQRAVLYAQKVEVQSLVTKFVNSLSTEQRDMLEKYRELTGGNDLTLTKRMLSELVHG